MSEAEAMQRSVEGAAPVLVLEGLKRTFHQGAREIRVGQVLANVVDQISERGVGERSERLMGSPSLAEKDVLVKEFLHEGNELDAELGGQDVARGNQKLFAEMGHLMGTNF